jgi:rod shape-determining protein MreD
MWAIVPLFVILAAAETSLARLAGIVSVRADIAIILVVFLAVRRGGAEGALLSWLLGLCQDSLSLAPWGLHGLIALATWSGLRLAGRWLLSQRRSIQVGMLVAASIFARLLVLLLAAAAGAEHRLVLSGLAWTPLHVLAQALLALPVWALARKLCDPGDLYLHPARI